LTIKLATPANIRQIKLLSHEYKIASRIEMQYYDKDQFSLLGHLNFEPNPDETLSRELKTIHLDITTTMLRLVMYNPYQQKKNIYQQVGLVAI
jgi:hypothetical protein